MSSLGFSTVILSGSKADVSPLPVYRGSHLRLFKLEGDGVRARSSAACKPLRLRLDFHACQAPQAVTMHSHNSVVVGVVTVLSSLCVQPGLPGAFLCYFLSFCHHITVSHATPRL